MIKAMAQPGPAPAVRALDCPACGGTIEMRAAGYTVTLICQYCSSVLDVTNPDARIITRYQEAAQGLEIPLGTRVSLREIEWEAIGYLRRSEGGYYPWDEYLLFNPYHGYRWLITDGRGWSLGTMLTAAPRWIGSGLMQAEGRVYTVFFRSGRARVDYVLGEFYWRVAAGEEVATTDYVCPGSMLSLEENGSERNWTVSELLSPREVRALGVEPPRPWWPGGPPPLPHQPSPYGGRLASFAKLGMAALAALLLIMIVFGGKGPRSSFEMALTPDAEARTATLGSIMLPRVRQAVTIDAYAPGIDNLWVDIDFSLIDRKTQASYEAYSLVEHYSGYDSDGSWSEGSRSNTTKMAIVPAGTYDLVVEASARRWGAGSFAAPGSDAWSAAQDDITLNITIAPGGTFFSNFLLALILLCAPIGLLVWLHLKFETARKGESDI